MFYKVLSILIFVGISVIAFYSFNFFFAVLALMLAIHVIYGRKQLDHSYHIEEHNKFFADHASNVKINFGINIHEILLHEKASFIYGKLKELNVINAKTQKIWADELLKNHKILTSKSAESLEYLDSDDLIYINQGSFHIKNNFIFKNRFITTDNNLCHSIEIPYDINSKKINRFITGQITIRLVLVDGFFKLQLGPYIEHISPDVLISDKETIYKTYETITSFPFIYIAEHFDFPSKFLNYHAGYTDSYAKWLHSRNLGRAKNEYYEGDLESDRDLSKYNSTIYSIPRPNYKTTDGFADKFKAFIALEGFDSVFDFGFMYSNKFLRIDFFDRRKSDDNKWFDNYDIQCH